MDLGALYLAVEASDVTKVRELLTRPGIDICRPLNSYCESAAYFAVRSGNCDIVESFLRHASFSANDEYWSRLLNLAIDQSHWSMLRLLFNHLSLVENYVPPVGNQLFHDDQIRCVMRCKSNKLSDDEINVLTILDEYEVDLHWTLCLKSAFEQQNSDLAHFIADNERSYPIDFPRTTLSLLLLHAYRTGNAELCKIILTHDKLKGIVPTEQIKLMCQKWPSCKPDVAKVFLVNNITGELCRNFLYTACILGHRGIVQVALPSKSLKTATDIVPLVRDAVENGYLEIVRILLESLLIDGEEMMNLLSTVFSVAARSSDKHMMELLLSYWPQTIVSIAKAQTGKALMHSAVIGGKLENVLYIQQLGVDVNFADGNRKTALHFATLLKGNSLQIVSTLLELGAKINVLDCHGQSPLSNACSKGDLDVVRYLLSKGADPCLKDFNLFGYNSPLLAAFQHLKADNYYDQSRQVEIMKLIIEAGLREGESFHYEFSHVIMDGFTTVEPTKNADNSLGSIFNQDVNEITDVYDFFNLGYAGKAWRQFELPLVKCLFDSVPDTSPCEISNMLGVLKDIHSLDAETGWTSLDYMNFIDIVFEKVVKFGKQSELPGIIENFNILVNSWRHNPYLGTHVGKKLCGLLDPDVSIDLGFLCDEDFGKDVLLLLKNCGLVNQVRKLVNNSQAAVVDVALEEPLSLQALVRIKLRQQMYTNCGNIEANISRLTLPSKLKDYLAFEM
ncbi:uncharacterized protein LOC141911010 [Tubulanus polymorphus]|uniref:uncharacterized protein LOC141911010 n=1 Tax=Tubulanus polymorphus TaxID=672921 RepID=UPI003DA51B7C